MSESKEDDVYLDAEEEVTPRRLRRKRRSTAGTPVETVHKKLRQTRMPTARSSGSAGNQGGSKKGEQGGGASPAGVGDHDAFWAKMSGLLGGMESRMKQETTDVKDQLGQAIGDLGSRVERTERRLDDFAEEVNQMVDKRLAMKWTLSGRAEHILDDPESQAMAPSSGQPSKSTGKPTPQGRSHTTMPVTPRRSGPT